MTTAVDTRPDYTVTADRARAMLDQLTADTWRAVEHAVLDLKVTADTLFADIAEREGRTTVTVEQLDTQEWPAVGETLTGELQPDSVNSAEVAGPVVDVPVQPSPYTELAPGNLAREHRERRRLLQQAARDAQASGAYVAPKPTRPEPAAESRWSRWARNVGDVLAWIGGRS